LYGAIDAGALPVLVNALKAHTNNPFVVDSACMTLRNIAFIPDGKEACVGGAQNPGRPFQPSFCGTECL
jgi:hypothetical protein